MKLLSYLWHLTSGFYLTEVRFVKDVFDVGFSDEILVTSVLAGIVAWILSRAGEKGRLTSKRVYEIR